MLLSCNVTRSAQSTVRTTDAGKLTFGFDIVTFFSLHALEATEELEYTGPDCSSIV